MEKNQTAWSTYCNFYADNRGHCFENGVRLSLDDVTFLVDTDGFEDSFASLDVLYNGPVLKDEVLDFLNGKTDKVRRANPLKALKLPTLLCVELEGGKILFMELKGQEFRQLLSIAQAKQKYSLTVSKRN